MSIISAGVTTTTSLVQTGNIDGTLQLQVNGTTPSVTLATTGAVGVGAVPSYGTAGQVLTSQGSGAAPTWTSATSQWTTSGSNIFYTTGNVGIGISSPTARVHAYSGTTMAQLTVDGAGAIRTGVNFASGGTTYGQVYFDNNAPYDMSVMQQYITGSLRFGTNNTERARFNSTGALVFAGGDTAANGIGITFPATQSASSNANTLDDYEEGSWTPDFSPASGSFTSITWANQTGRYVKVGRMVIAWGSVYTSAISVGTASGDLRISGLPFAVATGADAERGSGSVANCQLWNTSGNPESVGNVGGGTLIVLYKRTAAGGDQSRVQVSDANTGSNRNSMNFTFVYPVA